MSKENREMSKEQFEKYWLSTFEGLTSQEIIKYKEVHKYPTKKGFEAGYSLAQKELQKELDEAWRKIGSDSTYGLDEIYKELKERLGF